jgi:hypothetical protein
MRTRVAVVLVVGVLGTVLSVGGTRAQPVKPVPEGPKLWSAIGISPPVLDPDTITIDSPKVQIYLGLVNDGTQALETGLRESVLVVNGKPLQGKAWDAALKAGLRGDTWKKLPPGEHTVVACSLDEVIAEPGIYQVSWKGGTFQSPEVVYRLLPRASDSKPKPEPPTAAAARGAPKTSVGKLWAVASIVPPVLVRDTSTIRRTQLFLELVNDGTQTVETGTWESVLVVDGQPLRSRNWSMALRTGLISGTWLELPPGEPAGIVRPLHGIITDPGIYRVSWKGKDFQSPEVVFRILPAKAK